MTCQQQTIPNTIYTPSEVFELWQELLIALLVASCKRKKEEKENYIKKQSEKRGRRVKKGRESGKG